MHNWLKYTALATVVGLAACTSSPTGRNQLLLFSDQDMSALGAQSFEQMKQQQNPKTKWQVEDVVLELKRDRTPQKRKKKKKKKKKKKINPLWILPVVLS